MCGCCATGVSDPADSSAMTELSFEQSMGTTFIKATAEKANRIGDTKIMSKIGGVSDLLGRGANDDPGCGKPAETMTCIVGGRIDRCYCVVAQFEQRSVGRRKHTTICA